MKKINHKKGFTLIELIFSAAIISLIATVVLASLGVAKSKARDSERITELQSIQKALELSYITTGSYPQTDETGSENAFKTTNNKATSTMSNILQKLLDTGSISSIPTPPPQGSSIDGSYYYRTQNNTATQPNELYFCDGKTFGDGGLPYILYFYTELPQKLPVLAKGTQNNPTIKGYCFTNS